MRVLMLFLDGVGIGRRDPGVNPFMAARIPAFRSLFDGDFPTLRRRRIAGRKATVVPLDATFGVPGLPQSGTGQTALFAGVNGPKLAGRHFGPYPPSSVRAVLEEENIFRRVLALGKSPCFANAYPQRFFDFAEKRPTRLTVTTYTSLKSGVPLLRAEDLERGEGVSADITNESWKSLGYPEIPLIEPEEAGRRLARLSARHDFVLFEFWKTDHAGHSQRMEEGIAAVEMLDAMLIGILENLNASESLLIITSDHGNMEDMSVKTHTRNPVPVIFYGHGRERIEEILSSHSRIGPNLSHVAPALLKLLSSVP